MGDPCPITALAATMDLGKWAGLFGGAAAAGEETPVATASFAAVRNSTTSVSKGPGAMIDLQVQWSWGTVLDLSDVRQTPNLGTQQSF